jgi:hypothetical protein
MITVLYVAIFGILYRRQEEKRFGTDWQKASPKLNLFLIYSLMTFWFVTFVPKYLNYAIFWKVSSCQQNQ